MCTHVHEEGWGAERGGEGERKREREREILTGPGVTDLFFQIFHLNMLI